MREPRNVAVLDATAFRAACLRRGVETHGEVAELLGVHRTTVMRAVEHGQRIGPHLLAAIYATFPPEEIAQIIKVEKRPIAA